MNNWMSLILKGCWAVLVLPLQYSPGRRRKKKATQVRSLIVIFLEGGSLESGVQGLDDSDREVPHSCWRRIILLIGRHLAPQTKVELPHAVVAGVVGPTRMRIFD